MAVKVLERQQFLNFDGVFLFQGVGTIVNMMTKCGSQVVACVSDDKCKAALDCLQECDPLDQVTSSR